MGSWYALENISVKNNISCLQYNDTKEIITILKEIYSNQSCYEDIAREGRRVILEYHSGLSIAQQLFSLFNNC